MPVRAAVSSCFAEKQDEIVKHRLSNDCSDYLFAERSFDDTPAHLSFGMLSEFIAPIAKYVVPAKYRDMVGKSFADYKQIMALGIPAAQHGILDIFAERLVVEYGCGSVVEVMLPPRVMMGKKAGHIYRALQTSAGGSWSIEEFNAMSGNIIILVYNGDSASSNRKSLLYFGKVAAHHVWVFANRCLIHQPFRSVSVVLEKVALARPVKCLTNVFGISHRMDQFRHAVQQELKDNWRYHSGLNPPDENSAQRQHSRYLVDKLLVERTVREEFANPFETPSTETMRKKADLLWSYLQGPWDQPRVHHYCPPECPCGGTEEKAFATILELLFWVFCTRMPQAPNPARWATLGPACAWLSLALVTHGIFVRAWLRAFSKEAGAFRPEGEADANGDVGGEGEAFSVAVGRRLARVTQFVGNTTQTAACVTIGLVSQPVDDLTLTMLRLDEQGRALADMLSRRGQAPLRRAQRDVVTLLTDGEVAKAVTPHFDMSRDARETHMGMLRGIIVELGSAIYYRISLYLESYPFQALGHGATGAAGVAAASCC